MPKIPRDISGTLSQILKEIANFLKIGKDDFIKKLFE